MIDLPRCADVGRSHSGDDGWR